MDTKVTKDKGVNSKIIDNKVIDKQEYHLSISVFALPKDCNSQNSIFGGWLLENADLAALVECKQYSPGRYVTIGIDKLKFVQPVFIGDLVRFYTRIEKIGNTSITIKILAYANRFNGKEELFITEGLFTFVKTDENGNKICVESRD